MRMLRLWPTILCAVPLAVAAAGPGDGKPDAGVVSATVGEVGDAARREQEELRERAAALRERQATTDALLEKQDAYLRALEARLQALREHPAD